MVSCASFASDVDCVLQYQNEFNVKLILLMFLFGYILFSLWYSRNLDLSKSYSDMFKYISFNLFPKVLLVFFPWFLMTLKLDVSLELVITTVTMFYFLSLALFVGIMLFYGKEKIFSIIGDRRDISSKFKYMKHHD